jgi:hypothetical protein
MQPTPAGVTPQADFGSITVVIEAADDHFKKLLRLRAVKRELAELTEEQYQLEWQLFGKGAS